MMYDVGAKKCYGIFTGHNIEPYNPVVYKYKLVISLLAAALVAAISTKAKAQECTDPITKDALLTVLRKGVHRDDFRFLIDEIKRCRISFTLEESDEKELRDAGKRLGDTKLDELINTLQKYGRNAGRPDLSLVLVHPTGIAIVVVNLSGVVLREPKFTPAMWDLDREKWNEPLPIPVESGDWIRPHEGWGPNAFITQERIEPLIKAGDRLVGVIQISCPDCIETKVYWVYAIHGTGGWYSEFPAGQYPDLAKLSRAVPQIKANPDAFFAGIPKERRILISD